MISIVFLALCIIGAQATTLSAVEKTSGNLKIGHEIEITVTHGYNDGSVFFVNYGSTKLAKVTTDASAKGTVTENTETLSGRAAVTGSTQAETVLTLRLAREDDGKVIQFIKDGSTSDKQEYPINLEFLETIAVEGNLTEGETVKFKVTHSLAASSVIVASFDATALNKATTVASAAATIGTATSTLDGRATLTSASATTVTLELKNLTASDDGKIVKFADSGNYWDQIGYQINLKCPTTTTTTSGALSNVKTNMMVLAVLATFSSFLF